MNHKNKLETRTEKLNTEVPGNRRILQSRWVFAQKDDGRFRARCVAKGFTQIPGKDFTENHSPVLNDTTFHLILALKLLYKLESGQFDIETAFLYVVN
jgi:Reverse transcriptase (RNA-dependent DNA polymerase)